MFFRYRSYIFSRLSLKHIALTVCLSSILFPNTARTQLGLDTPFSATSSCTLNACFAEGSINMDGRMNESAWAQAEPATRFFQREPREGAPATEKTEVRILYDDTNLYIGVYCYDSEPGRIVHNELRFDGDLAYDDNFTVVLDTFADRRNGFFFRINPNGARLDARLANGSRPNTDWNGVWDTAARINDDGWSAEIVIPLSTLRFNEVNVQEWGINFQRMIAWKNEEVLWAAWSRDYGITQLSQAGMLCNLRGIERGSLLEVKPYLLGGIENDDGERDNEIKYGVDVKYPLTSDLTLDLTTYTDFAQIEADRTQINLTRFSLRYPEKRDFFLEGADILEFGSPMSTPFYTRNIGLSKDREAIPILAGAKVTGKAGRYSIGILDMQTDADDGKGVPSTNYSAVRIKRDIMQQSSVGFIYAGVHDETGHWDRTLGADFDYVTNSLFGNKNFSISTWYERNFKEGGAAGKHTGQFFIRYPNDLVSVTFNYKESPEDYEPELGYYQRNGVRQVLLTTMFSPRPDIPHIRQLMFSGNFRYYEHYDTHKLETRYITFSPFGFRTLSEDTFRIMFTNSYDFLYRDFNIFNDTVISPGGYEWWEGTASLRTNSNRPLSANLTYETGDFYSGTKQTLDSSLTMKFNHHLSVEPAAIYNDLAFGDESFSTQEYSMRLNTNISPRLSIRTYVQWNNDDEIANLNFRIHYIPQVGSDIYLVYNHLWNGMQDYRTTYDATLAKIAWRFAF